MIADLQKQIKEQGDEPPTPMPEPDKDDEGLTELREEVEWLKTENLANQQRTDDAAKNAAEATTKAEQEHQQAQEALVAAEKAGQEVKLDPGTKAVINMLADQINKRKDQPDTLPPPKREFNFNGQLVDQIVENDCEGITYCHVVKGAVRDAIAQNEFISLGKILHDTVQGVPISCEMNDGNYSTHNVPPPPESIKTLVELICRLLLFATFYLQKYPHKMVSFLDYMLCLIDHADQLNIQGLVTLDHMWHQEFTINPHWNWSQHRDQNIRTRSRVVKKDMYKGSCLPGRNFGNTQNFSGNNNKGKPQTQYQPNKGQKHKYTLDHGSKPKCQFKTPEDRAKETCLMYNKNECKWGENCQRKHICVNCHGKHCAFECKSGETSKQSE